MHVKRFQKKKEDFICDNCSTKVTGNGYTNHCPACLYSKHVDIFPGDRKETCGGLMKVSDIQKKGETYVITHTCTVCKARVGDHFREQNDSFEALVALSVKLQEKK